MSRKYLLSQYEIWVGNYDLGQGYSPPKEPKKLATIEAPSFKIACVLYELRSKLKTIEGQIEKDRYISDQDLKWWYDIDKNYNPWIGPYFESYEEALESFK